MKQIVLQALYERRRDEKRFLGYGDFNLPISRDDFLRVAEQLIEWKPLTGSHGQRVDGRGYINGNGVDSIESHLFENKQRGIKNISESTKTKAVKEENSELETRMEYTPPVITESLIRFHADHPNSVATCFIMMRFGETPAHDNIVKAIRSACEARGISALRADDKEYHDDLFPNVLTYIYGSSFGIAVYERIEEESFNPNVSLELGYMLALRKPVMILKDKTLKSLQTDLVGKLYKQFDSQDPKNSIPSQITRWLDDRDLSNNNEITARQLLGEM